MQAKFILKPTIPHNFASVIPQKLITDETQAKNVTIQGGGGGNFFPRVYPIIHVSLILNISGFNRTSTLSHSAEMMKATA